MTDDIVAEPVTAPAAEPEPDSAPEPAPQDDASAPRPGIEALRDEWGERYDANIAAARRLAGDIATPELVAAIDRAGLGDDPHLIRAVAQLATRVYRADGAVPEGAGRTRKRLDELHGLQHHPDPAKRAQYRSKPVQAELERLYTALYGDGPVVGQARAL